MVLAVQIVTVNSQSYPNRNEFEKGPYIFFLLACFTLRCWTFYLVEISTRAQGFQFICSFEQFLKSVLFQLAYEKNNQQHINLINRLSIGKSQIIQWTTQIRHKPNEWRKKIINKKSKQSKCNTIKHHINCNNSNEKKNYKYSLRSQCRDVCRHLRASYATINVSSVLLLLLLNFVCVFFHISVSLSFTTRCCFVCFIALFIGIQLEISMYIREQSKTDEMKSGEKRNRLQSGE